MSDTTTTQTQTEIPEDFLDTTEASERHVANMLTLEILFLGFIGVVVLIAFVQALGYAMVSARTPFVIMVPLFALIAVQAKRLWGLRGHADLRTRMSRVFSGENQNFNKVLGFSGWMGGLLVLIVTLGHYIGIVVFTFILMRPLGKEKLKLTLIVTAATTLAIYLIFEVGFNVELYRGLLFRYFMGYRDF